MGTEAIRHLIVENFANDAALLLAELNCEVEAYLSRHSRNMFSYSICPACVVEYARKNDLLCHVKTTPAVTPAARLAVGGTSSAGNRVTYSLLWSLLRLAHN